MTKKTKSPIKSKPLRYAGQSLDEQLDKLINEQWVPWASAALFMIMLAAMEWYKWLFDFPPKPWIFSILAISFVAFVVYKYFKLRRQVDNIKLGREGERAVADLLDDLKSMGARVFHDVVGDGFNLDHVVVSDRGIFTIETKTYSKPEKGAPKIQYDGKRILKSGHLLDRDPVGQSKAQAKWLNDLLRKSTGKSFFVKPVVVFPGWFVERTTKRQEGEVCVLNPDAFVSIFKNQEKRLTDEEVNMASLHLERYIKSQA